MIVTEKILTCHGLLEVSYETKYEKTKLKRFSLGSLQFDLSSVWINEQPLRGIKKFKFKKIEATELIGCKQIANELFLTLKTPGRITVTIYYQNVSLSLQLDPHLTISGLVKTIQRKLNLTDLTLSTETGIQFDDECQSTILEFNLDHKKLVIEEPQKSHLTHNAHEGANQKKDHPTLEVKQIPISMPNFNKGEAKTLLPLAVDGPKWRLIIRGLNFWGPCSCRDEEDKWVCVQMGFKENLFISKARTEAKCPMCDKVIEIKTCIFWDCIYIIKGSIEKQPRISPRTEIAPKENAVTYMPEEKNLVKWDYLKITTKPNDGT